VSRILRLAWTFRIATADFIRSLYVSGIALPIGREADRAAYPIRMGTPGG